MQLAHSPNHAGHARCLGRNLFRLEHHEVMNRGALGSVSKEQELFGREGLVDLKPAVNQTVKEGLEGAQLSPCCIQRPTHGCRPARVGWGASIMSRKVVMLLAKSKRIIPRLFLTFPSP